MAIISCPYCQQKVSDKAAVCGKCGGNLADVSPEQLERFSRDKRLAQSQNLNNQAMIALVIFLGSFCWYYYRVPEQDSLELHAVNACMVLGCLWYVVTKARIVLFKRK